MAQKKQVIHVKDLVIKADNVHVERTSRRRKRDPFFGFPIEEKQEESPDYKKREAYQEKEDDKESTESKDDKGRYHF